MKQFVTLKDKSHKISIYRQLQKVFLVKEILTYNVIIVFFSLITACNMQSNSSEKERLADSLRKDSIRIQFCDNLYKNISKEDKIKSLSLPDTIPANIEECVQVLNKHTAISIMQWMKCVNEDEYIYKLHFGLGLYIRNHWELWGNSILVKYFNNLGIFHPDDMSSIILSCFYQQVNFEKYDLKKKIDFYINYWKKQKETEENLQKGKYKRYLTTKKFVDSLHETIHYDSILKSIKGLTYDSANFFITRIKKDTLSYFTTSSLVFCSKENYINEVKSPNFGKTIFFGNISNDGLIYIRSLKITRFLRRSDSLFYEDKEDRTNFVCVFTPLMKKNSKSVVQWKPKKDGLMSKSIIIQKWVYKKKMYFLIELQGKLENSDLRVRYYIDENLNVIFDENLKSQLWSCNPLIKE